MAEPCLCNQQNPECHRAGLPMVGRLWELCSGTNCSKATSEKYRTLWDSHNNYLAPSIEPSSTDKVKNFLLAISKYAINGFKNVSSEDYEKRLITCNDCDKNKHGVCQECGCFIGVKAKWATEDCPLGKWPKIELPMIEQKGSGCGGCGKRS